MDICAWEEGSLNKSNSKEIGNTMMGYGALDLYDVLKKKWMTDQEIDKLELEVGDDDEIAVGDSDPKNQLAEKD
jgi:hypothetical protein